jgi:hypothetical protein
MEHRCGAERIYRRQTGFVPIKRLCTNYVLSTRAAQVSGTGAGYAGCITKYFGFPMGRHGGVCALRVEGLFLILVRA